MRRFCLSLLAIVLSLSTGIAVPQNYPTKPIRIIATGPGGGNDFQARMIAQGIAPTIGSVVVENRPGGLVPGETVAKSAPDGYTLLGSPGVLWIAPLLQHAPYDAVRDFAPISLALRAPVLLVVNSHLPVKSVKELVALAKSAPGKLNYSSSGTGAIGHLSAELFKSMAKVNIVRVAYKSGATEMNDLMSGEVQLSFGTLAALRSQIKTGKLRPLAVASLQPSPLVSELRTLATDLPGFEASQQFGILAPAKTPDFIVRRLHQEIVRFVATQDAKQRFSEAGIETIGTSPEEFATVIKAEIERWSKVIKIAGITAE